MVRAGLQSVLVSSPASAWAPGEQQMHQLVVARPSGLLRILRDIEAIGFCLGDSAPQQICIDRPGHCRRRDRCSWLATCIDRFGLEFGGMTPSAPPSRSLFDSVHVSTYF
jgi:hypothetical protein